MSKIKYFIASLLLFFDTNVTTISSFPLAFCILRICRRVGNTPLPLRFT